MRNNACRGALGDERLMLWVQMIPPKPYEFSAAPLSAIRSGNFLLSVGQYTFRFRHAAKDYP